MKRKLSFLGFLMALCLGLTAYAQEPVLHFRAVVRDGVFRQVGGAGDYTLNLNGCEVDGDALVVGSQAPYVTGLNFPAGIGQAEAGLTVFLKVSQVPDATTLAGCFFDMIGHNNFKIGTYLNGAGKLIGYGYSGESIGGTFGPSTVDFPIDDEVHIVAHSLRRPNAIPAGNSSKIYLDGELAINASGLHADNDVTEVYIGGRRSGTGDEATSVGVMTGMRIHEVLIYSNEVTSETVTTITSQLIGLTYDAGVYTDGNGTARFLDQEDEDFLIGIYARTPLTIEATPNEGYIFDKWVDNDDESIEISTDNPYTFRLAHETHYKALFLAYSEKIITVSISGMGTTNKTGQNQVIMTDDFTVTATANLGHVFVNWVNADNEEDVISTEATYTYEGRENLNLKAVFKMGPVSATWTPVPDDGKWYFVQSQRGSSNYYWTLAEGDVNAKANGSVDTRADNQKFTLISLPNGNVTFKAYDGRIMVGSGNFEADTEGPEQGWAMVSNIVNGVQGYAFQGELLGLHNYNAGHAWAIKSGYYSLTDNCTYFFHYPGAETTLRTLYNNTLAMYDNAQISDRPGDFTSLDGKAALYAALELATVSFGGTEAEVEEATVALQTAIAAFDAQRNRVVASTADAPVWYMITCMGSSYANGAVLHASSEGEQCTWGTVAPLTDNKLFRFEANPTNPLQYRIISAAYPNGQLNGNIYDEASEEPVYYELVANDGASGAKFQIVCTSIEEGATQLHAQQTNALVVLYNSTDYSGASMWQFEKFEVDMRLELVIETAEVWADGAVVNGSAGNHKNQSDVDAFKAAIATAKSYLGSSDVTQLTAAQAALEAAMEVFDAAGNTIEASTADAPIYYMIVNGMVNGYATNKILYTVDDTSVLRWQNIEPLNENKFFFFEANAENPALFRIINAAYPDGALMGIDYGYDATPVYFEFVSYRGAEGAKFQIVDVASDNQQLHARNLGDLVYYSNNNYSSASMWKIMKVSDYLADRYQELVDEMGTLIDEEGNPKGFQLGEEDGNYGQEEFDLMVDAYQVMVADLSSGGATLHETTVALRSAIAEFRASQIITDSIGSATVATIKVSVVNGTIVAEGTDASVQVYTIAGARKQNRNLESGLYVGRVADSIFKIMVK